MQYQISITFDRIKFLPRGIIKDREQRHLADKLIGVLSALHIKTNTKYYEISTMYECVEK